MPIIDHADPKIIEATSSLPEFVPTCKKTVYLFCSFLRQSIFEAHDQTGHIHFWPCPAKIFWSIFNFHEFALKSKKSRYFIDFFCRYRWFIKNLPIWLAESILAHTSEQFSQILDLHANTASNPNSYYRTNW